MPRYTDAAMRTGLLTTFLMLAVSAIGVSCASAPTPPNNEAVRDSVHAFMETIPAGLAAEGPKAWLRFFEDTPSFFMASDGQIAFPGRDSAEVFLERFARDVYAMELTWESIRVEPIIPSVAVVVASYSERITARDGTVAEFGGYVTGVARRNAGGWKLQHLHWSSPADE